MSKTPSKCFELQSHNFSPKELFTPNKDTPGISKTVFTQVSTLNGLLRDWIKIQENGTKICKAVSALKLHECTDDYYPQQLKSLTESLVEALHSLKHIVKDVETVDNQLKALAKLQNMDQPVIFTWSVKQISHYVSNILQSLQKEYQLKQTITENIAHCRDENLIELYLSSWEFETYFDIYSSAYLFADVGLPYIT